MKAIIGTFPTNAGPRGIVVLISNQHPVQLDIQLNGPICEKHLTRRFIEDRKFDRLALLFVCDTCLATSLFL